MYPNKLKTMKALSVTFWIVYLLVAVFLQFIVGNFPFSFFSFPLNFIFAAIWLTALWMLYKDYRLISIMRFMLSPAATVGSLAAFTAGCLVIGMFPQLSAAEAAHKSGILARLGCYDFMSSWIFVAILFFLLSHLALITYRGAMAKRRHKWRFILNHAGLWLALFAGFFGSADARVLRIPVVKGEPNSRAYTMEGKVTYLDYELELLDFRADYYENGMPRQYEAQVRVGKEPVVLKVNHPYAYRLGEDLYLTGYEKKSEGLSYCVLQVVEQPWKYVQLAGILLTLAGGILLFLEGPVKKNENDNLG